MNKKFKITYWVVMALNAAVCIVDIATARYFGAAFAGVTVIWLFVCYLLANTVYQQETLIDDLLKQLKDDATLLDKYKTDIEELAKREKIHQQEFAKMRVRAQEAEIKLQQMIDDTPARGKDGRYIKREN
jgi:cell division protein FtsL